jgi:antitoxin (DNA-binding transcriptional repressor) of toxin-antitoxin stability system
MPSVNMRELRNTRQIKAWLRAGKSIELRDRNHVVGRIVPDSEPKEMKEIEWPDFEARRRKIFGDRDLNAVENFLKDRHRE